MGDFDISTPSNSEAASISAKIMVIAMIVLFFVVAFCFFLSLYAKWYWSRNEDPSVVLWRRRVARQGPPAARVAPKQRGLDHATLESLPVVVYDPKDFKEGLECSVCLSEISNGEKIRLLPKCNHGFHVVCIDMWFKSHSTCPLCRDSVRSSNQEVHEVDEHATSTTLSDSDSDSDSNSDSDSVVSRAHVVNSGETSFPTNVLIWGNEATNSVAATSSSSNNNGVATQKDELVINIPSDLCNDCSSASGSTTGLGEEEAKIPVVSRMKSLKRLLSRGKRVAPWASGSSSEDLESSQSKPNN